VRLWLAALAVCTPVLFVQQTRAADSALKTADAKMDRLGNLQAKHGEVVDFSPAEVDAWVRDEVPKAVSQGIRDPKVELGQDTAVASAMVDLVKIEQARGKTPGMVSKMFEGERPLKVSLRLQSAGGKGTVSLTRVEIGGASLEGAVLNLLIKTFFTPLYPDAKINEPFEIGYNIDRIELRPDGIRVTIKK
jgi:hypothetical protein